jgi:outer membrane receptor protein involved in Fe transport
MKKNISCVFGARFRPNYLWRLYFLSGYTLFTSLSLLASGNALAADALDQTIALEIAPNTPLDEALIRWGAETGVQVMMSADTVAKEKTKGVRGTQSASHALAALLQDSGLSYTVEGSTVHVVPAHITDQTESKPASSSDSPKKAKVGDGSTQTDARRKDIEEVIVTAQKRDERLQDVPMSLTALSGDTLEQTHSFQFEDYVGTVPGLSLIATNARINQLVIRGISTGSGGVNGSVATYIDETPYGAVGPIAVPSSSAPNLDTFDMQRIEVLRGPQGTLYGANALGGLFKYVTNAPDLMKLTAKLAAGMSSVANGGPGYDVHGMVNVPLGDTAAVRLVGYTNRYPGFIDDPSRNASGVNASRFSGGRASVQWSPVNTLTVRLNALFQDRKWEDYPNEDVNPTTLTPIYGNYKQVNLINQPGNDKTQIYNATVNWDFGFAKLVSATSYARNQWQIHAVDYSKQFGVFLDALPGSPYGFDVSDETDFNGITQELRLSSASNQSLEWLVGGYLTNQNSTQYQPYFPIDINTHTVLFNFPTNVGSFNIPVHYHEWAAFGDVDYHLLPQFDVGVGGRYSKNSQTFHETGAGLFGAGIDIANQSSEDVFTYSADLRWHIDPQNMIYARVAKGFVPGGPNNAIPNAVVQSSYHSSTTLNYELGLKSQFLDDRLFVDLSAFDIEWHDIQVVANIGGFNTTTNAGAARSKGFEWSVAYAPFGGLTLNWNGAYTDAHLTEATPTSVGGVAGSRLPGVPLWQMSIGAQYERRLLADYSGFIGLNWRFMGRRFADFEPVGSRQEMPSFRILDLRAGVQGSTWSVSLYAKNVADAIAINYLTRETFQGGLGPQSASLYTPRTIGFSVTKDF